MSDTVLTANFFNYSSGEWKIDECSSYTQSGVSGVTQQPSNSLKAGDGVTTFQYEQNLGGTFVDGDAGIWCCWNNGTSRFGVKLWAPLQMFSLGTSPKWYYMSDTNLNSSDINWVYANDPAAQYTWPKSLGANVVAVPDAESSSLTLTVTIEDA